jgi:hypothetical protein
MRLNEEMGGLAVPDPSKSTVCDRCFAQVLVNAGFCPECGAPIGDASAESSDAAVYQELARANLLRMRGDYKGAEEQCLAILRKLPNNASANTLLGDICAERDDLEHAVQWYELSLDLADVPSVQEKLRSVQQRIKDREAAATAEQLGLPSTQPKTGVFLAGVLALILVIGVSSFFLGKRAEDQSNRANPKLVRTTTQAPSQGDIDSGTTPLVGSGPEATVGQPDPGSINDSELLHVKEDLAFLGAVRGALPEGPRLWKGSEDPRTLSGSVTFQVSGTQSPESIAVEVAKAVFSVRPNMPSVTLRAVKDGSLLFVCNVDAAKWLETQSEEWRQANGSDVSAIAEYVLRDRWMAPSAQIAASDASATASESSP